MQRSDIKDLIGFHLDWWNREEKPAYDYALQCYQGNPFGDETQKVLRGRVDGPSEDPRTSTNLIWQVVETANYMFGSRAPSIAVRSEAEALRQVTPAIANRLNAVLAANSILDVTDIALTFAPLAGRAPLKVTWDNRRLRPKIRPLTPGRLFFDPHVLMRQDIGYWLEATDISVAELRRRMTMPRRTRDGAEHPPLYRTSGDLRTGPLPDWLNRLGGDKAASRKVSPRKRAVVWEFYDRDEMKVYHVSDEAGSILLEADLDFPAPYTMYMLNFNGESCHGLSEVKLILNIQRVMNDILTLIVEIAYLQVPKIGFDPAALDPQQVAQGVQERQPGSWVPLARKNADGLPISEHIFEIPRPVPGDTVFKLLEVLSAVAERTSALADASRGQIANARTATEIAAVIAQMETRLGRRKGRFASTLAEAARIAFELDRLYLPNERWLAVPGASGAGIDLDELRAIHGLETQLDIDIDIYQPLHLNPGMVLESLQNLLGYLATAETLDKDAMDRFLAREIGAPPEVIRSETEMAELRQAAASAGAALAPGASPAMAAGASPAMAAEAVASPGEGGSTLAGLRPSVVGQLPAETVERAVGV